MRNILFFLACGVMLLNCSEAPTNDSTSPEIETTESQINSIEEALHEHVAILASDEYGGRAPATAGEELTINYLRDNFTELGVGPGNGDSYFQPVAVTEIVTANDAILYLQGSDYEASFNYGSQMMVGTQQQIPFVTVQGSDVVFVGYGIVAPERNWNDYAGQ